MLVAWFLCGARVTPRGCGTLVLLAIWLAAPRAAAATFKMCLDPGHPNKDAQGNCAVWGTSNPNCTERWLNHDIANLVKAGLPSAYYSGSYLTKSSSETCMSLQDRCLAAIDGNADAFVSLHHNGVEVLPSPEYAFVAWTSDSIQGGLQWQLSQQLAASVADWLNWFVSRWYGYDDHGAEAHNYFVLRGNHVAPAILAEPVIMAYGPDPGPYTATEAGADLCDLGWVRSDEAMGYITGLDEMFGGTAVGTSFSAVGGFQCVNLYWDDDDPGTTYTIRRSDSCWGPYTESVATVPWNASGQYAYTDGTVIYDREYSYQLVVSPSGEMVTADAAPQGFGGNIHPGPPTDLVASVDGVTGVVTLSYTAASNGYGFMNYNVVRGLWPMNDCHSPHEMIGTTSDLTYEDTTAVLGETYYYRVIADDSEGHSDPSNEVSLWVPSASPENVGSMGEPLRLTAARGGAGLVRLTVETAVPEVVRVEIVDVTGRRVGTPLRDVVLQGRQSYTWKGDDERGKAVGSGVYFVRALTKSGIERRAKVVLLR